jgi:hypothetical protein
MTMVFYFFMKKVSVFVTLVLCVLLIITFGSAYGFTVVSQTHGASVGISSIGVIIVAFIFLFSARRRAVRKVMDDSVWRELEVAEQEWERKK